MTEQNLQLQSAYLQTVRDQDANQWIIYSSSNERLGSLPAGLNNSEAMGLMHFARAYELKAFNAGANVGRERAERAHGLIAKQLNEQMDLLAKENMRLAHALEKHLIETEKKEN